MLARGRCENPINVDYSNMNLPVGKEDRKTNESKRVEISNYCYSMCRILSNTPAEQCEVLRLYQDRAKSHLVMIIK
jgi:hypothetical protein